MKYSLFSGKTEKIFQMMSAEFARRNVKVYHLDALTPYLPYLSKFQ